MKRTVFTMACMMALAFGAPQTAGAQLGKIISKAKKAVKDVNSILGTQDAGTGNKAADDTPAVAAVPIPGGGEMQNPLAKAMDVELVGAYGKSSSLNYGSVYLVLKVRMNLNMTKASFGSANNVRGMAVDEEGNTYPMDTMGAYPKDVTEGLFVKVVLDDKDLQFKDVRKTAKMMQMIRLGVYIDASHRGVITFKNVPIQWEE